MTHPKSGATGMVWFFLRRGCAFRQDKAPENGRRRGYFYNSERGYPGAAVKKDYGISLLNEDRQKDRNFFFQGSLRQEVTDFYSYKIQAKYANDYMNYVMPPESTVQPMDNHYWQQEVYVTAANLVRFHPVVDSEFVYGFPMEQTRCGRHRYVQCAFHRTEALYVAGSHSHIGQPQTLQRASQPALHICA